MAAKKRNRRDMLALLDLFALQTKNAALVMHEIEQQFEARMLTTHDRSSMEAAIKFARIGANCLLEVSRVAPDVVGTAILATDSASLEEVAAAAHRVLMPEDERQMALMKWIAKDHGARATVIELTEDEEEGAMANDVLQ